MRTKTVARALLAVLLLGFMLTAVELETDMLPAWAVTGSIPPPDTCSAYPYYHYNDQNCWGTAKPPPANCVVSQSKLNTADPNCTTWAAALPQEAQTNFSAITLQQNQCGQLRYYNIAQGKCVNDVAATSGNTDNNTTTQGLTANGAANPTLAANGVDSNTQAICTELQTDVKQTRGGGANGPFATLYSQSGCNYTGDPKATTPMPTALSACKALTTLSTYAGADANNNGTSATGLTPAGALALNQKIKTASSNFDCAGVIKAGGETAKTAHDGTGTVTNIKNLIDGLEYYALAFCIGAIFISGALWAVGSKGQNPGQELTGKRGILVAITAALLIGSIPPIMNFLTNQAKANDQVGVLSSQLPTAKGATVTCTLANKGNGVCP